MVWNGAKGNKKQKPVCFVGKGVVFDTGGISIKPAAGMEDMKGDMGGAAAVIGVMHALAERKANVNAVGLIGCVENMPSGNAVRPGDIVTSMSGQTIEIINTDAEGRLVLADVLWYAQEKFKPKLIINLATLTGAIMIALGKEYAGMFSNDDKLAEELSAASRATGEKVWRMPLDKAFDKAMDSQVRRHEECRRALGRIVHGGGVPAALHQGHAVVPSRRRRHGDGRRQVPTSTPAGVRAGACGCSTGSSPTTTRRTRSRPDELGGARNPARAVRLGS